VIEERDAMVAMRDGVALAVDVFRPDGEQPVPALLAMSAYGKNAQSLPIAPQPWGTTPRDRSSVYNRGIEAGDPDYLTAHGFAHVIPDLRGIGASEGEYLGWCSPQEAEDGHDLVEWIAAQPWCDGNVGMVGVSYFGAIQPLVAATQPPHLKAIMPWNAPADFYRECTHHGGILQSFFFHLYGGSIQARAAATTKDESSPEELERRIEERLADPALTVYSQSYEAVKSPERMPGWFDIVMHPTDGPFYRERSPAALYDRIRIPSYCFSHWWGYPHMHLRGAFDNFLGIGARNKLRIDGMEEDTAPFPAAYNAEVVRWYDHWLKGIDNGIMDEPPISLHVMGTGQSRAEHEWPLARTDWTPYYLRRWQGLATEPEHVPGGADCFVQQPADETSAISSVAYVTSPFARATEITGPISLTLYASIDADDTHWIVALSDLAPDGSSAELTKGFLKASHRAVDEERSEPWRPYHPHLAPEPVTPGEVVEYRIELSPTSNLFRPGHRLRLTIASLDLAGKASNPTIRPSHVPWHFCSAETVLHRIFHDAEHPSQLLLPLVSSEASAVRLQR
jgi:hypothetical protein